MNFFRCPPEFVYLYREFGGSLWIRDSRQRLATEISDRAPALALMKQLQGKIVDCLFLLKTHIMGGILHPEMSVD